jgi:hypothetical protein
VAIAAATDMAGAAYWRVPVEDDRPEVVMASAQPKPDFWAEWSQRDSNP